MPLPGKLLKKINESKAVKISQKRIEPLWKGPESDHDQGGITYSMLCKFLNCRERFRMLVIDGVRSDYKFDAKTGFGNMWHVCEEHFAKTADSGKGSTPLNNWAEPLKDYVKELVAEYPAQQDEIFRWFQICKTQFPVYIDFWRKHPDVTNRTPVFQEHVFKVPYKLPSGRIVYLRGKYDSVDLIKMGRTENLWIQENKTKSKIVEEQLRRQLKFDLQTMIYVISLQNLDWTKVFDAVSSKSPINVFKGLPKIGGVRYNVIRRDAPIKRHEAKNLKSGFKPAETWEHYCNRLKTEYIEADPKNWFRRFKVDVSAQDIERFKQQCLDPILENLCDWYKFVTIEVEQADRDAGFPFVGSHLHWRHPYGVYNILNEGGASDVDDYLDTGSMIGLTKVEELFTELKAA